MNKTRRNFVKAFATGAMAIPLGALVSLRLAQAAEMPRLDLQDPTAKSLLYTHQSADANKLCSGCQFYTGAADAEWGACMIFQQKLVSADGVCNSWFKRAS
jgi:hypothetical protein